jgi:hypothetical protein
VQVCSIERELKTDPFGMSLAEEKSLLAAVQLYLVERQHKEIASAHAYGEQCDARLDVKE